MNEGITILQRERVIEALDKDSQLARKMVAMVDAARISGPDAHSELSLPKVPDIRADRGTGNAGVIQRKSPFQVAEQLGGSYCFKQETGFSTFKLPAGISDGLAMRVLNRYFRIAFPRFGRDAIDPKLIAWCEALPELFPQQLTQRDYSKDRWVTIEGVVKDSLGKSRGGQLEILVERGLVFADPRDQVIAAALHACVNDGYNYLWEGFARGSVPGFAVGSLPGGCLTLRPCSDMASTICEMYRGVSRQRSIGASGSPLVKCGK